MIITDWIIVAVVAAIAISDLLLVWRRIPTYSNRLRKWGSRVSFFPYAWGVLGGHFWGPCGQVIDWKVTIVALVLIGLLVTAAHQFIVRSHHGFVQWLSLLLYLPGGMACGAIFWPQGG